LLAKKACHFDFTPQAVGTHGQAGCSHTGWQYGTIRQTWYFSQYASRWQVVRGTYRVQTSGTIRQVVYGTCRR
jgi:hypothetical protein